MPRKSSIDSVVSKWQSSGKPPTWFPLGILVQKLRVASCSLADAETRASSGQIPKPAASRVRGTYATVFESLFEWEKLLIYESC